MKRPECHPAVDHRRRSGHYPKMDHRRRSGFGRGSLRGQITIVVCLILPVYLTLMLVLLGGAQAACARDYWSYSVLSAKENVKASYCRELFDEFQIFAVYEGNTDAQEIVQKTLEIGEKPPYLFSSLIPNFLLIRFRNPSARLAGKTGLIDSEGSVLRRAIVKAEHGVVIQDLAGELVGFVEAFQLGKEKEQEIPSQSRLDELEENHRKESELNAQTSSSSEAGEVSEPSGAEGEKDEEDAETAEKNRLRKELISVYERVKEASPIDLMLMPSDSVSTKAYPSQRSGIESAWHFEDLIPKLPENVLGMADGLLIDDYCRKYAKSFADSGEDHRYELEYVISGRKSDRESLEATLAGFLLIRTATNIGSLLTMSPVHQAAIEGICSPLLAIPFAYPIGLVLVDTAMAFGEAVIDGRRLLHGKRVAIVKKDADWKLDVAHCARMILDPSYVPESDPAGLSYETYLFFQLLFCREKTKLARMGDVIQWRLMEYDDEFRLAACNVGYDLELEADYPEGFYPFGLPSPGLTAEEHVSLDE